MLKGETILDYLKSNHECIRSDCNGNKSCGKCLVKVTPELTITESDKRFLHPSRLKEGYRLACCHPFEGYYDIEIISESDGIVNSQIYLAQHADYEHRDSYSVAIDIGTTTVVVMIMKVDGTAVSYSDTFFNPQRSYGSDVITRIHAACNGSLNMLHKLIIDSIETSILKIIKKHGLPKQLFESIVISGNTTMMYLLLGKDPIALGTYPFEIDDQQSFLFNIVDCFKNLSFFSGVLYIVPYASAFIGGDVVSGIVACGIDHSNENMMLIDLGTNGEMIVGNRDKLISVSTAVGPAFEGGNIECGMPSIKGAIASIEVVKGNMSYNTIGNTKAAGICGSGLIQIIDHFINMNIMDETGYLANNNDRFYIDEERNIYVSQKDIRQVQLAKAALQTGVKTLLENGFFNPMEISKVFIAGGFGSSIDARYLASLGVIPESILEKCHTINNASLSGAVYLALTNDFDRFMRLRNKIHNINLVELNNFNTIFIDSMIFKKMR